MATDASDLNLLMVHADDHAPVLADGLDESTARGQRIAGATDEASHFWDEGGDPNDLEVQRWGVIAPQGPEGERLLALLQPLLTHRQEQQGDAVRVYRVPPRMTQDEAMRWKKRDHFVVPSWATVEHRADSDAVLFSFSDRPVQEKLDLWREDRGGR